MRGVLLVLALACGCRQSGRELGPDPKGNESVKPSPPPAPSAPPKGPPLQLVVANLPSDAVELRVKNVSEEPVSLAEDIDLQHEEAGVFVSTHYEVWIEPGCQRGKSATCVTISPGEELRPTLWMGMSCGASCPCRANVMAAPGTYRFVVRRCDATGSVTSSSFVWP